jgi:molybdenum cofactor guanylyltransferase
MEGFILAGGKSSRMGTPKAGLLLGGTSMLEWAAGALSTVANGGITIVGGAEASANQLAWIPDAHEGVNGQAVTGPLIGLYSAISHAHTDLIAVIACDLPFVTSQFFEMLVTVDTDEYDAVVPVQPDGRFQPLCAIYRREHSLYAILRSFEAEELSMRSLLQGLRVRYVQPSEYAGLRYSQYFFVNVNTPQQYEEALSLAAGASKLS